MKKYRVETDIIEGIAKGEEMEESRVKDYLDIGCPESWFSPVEEEFKEGDYVHVQLRTYGMGGIIRITRIDESNSHPVRFMDDGVEDGFLRESIKRKATKDEIEAALIAEAKRREFKKGIQIKRHWEYKPICGDGCYLHHERKICSNNFEYKEQEDALFLNRWVIYQEGKWAEIVDEPITINGTVFTEALNELANKPEFIREIFYECVGKVLFKDISDPYILVTVDAENAQTMVGEVEEMGLTVTYINEINKYKIRWGNTDET